MKAQAFQERKAAVLKKRQEVEREVTGTSFELLGSLGY